MIVVTRDQLRQIRCTKPFRPFMVRMAGGGTFTIRQPENISCDVRGRNLVIHDRDGMHFLGMLLAELIEPADTQAEPAAGENGN